MRNALISMTLLTLAGTALLSAGPMGIPVALALLTSMTLSVALVGTISILSLLTPTNFQAQPAPIQRHWLPNFFFLPRRNVHFTPPPVRVHTQPHHQPVPQTVRHAGTHIVPNTRPNLTPAFQRGQVPVHQTVRHVGTQTVPNTRPNLVPTNPATIIRHHI